MELRNEIERILYTNCPWKEYINSDGRKYWYNKETKISTWTIPDEIKQLKDVNI